MVQRKVTLCASARTAVDVLNGKLITTMAPALDATVIHTALTRFAFGTLGAGTVVLDNLVHAGNKMNPTRRVAASSGTTARSQQRVAAPQSVSGQVP